MEFIRSYKRELPKGHSGKVRKGNYKRGHDGTRSKLAAERARLSLFQVLLKLMVTYGKGRT
jgi:hypothetical protein